MRPSDGDGHELVARIRGAESERSGSWGHWGSGPAEMNITPGRRRANTRALAPSGIWSIVISGGGARFTWPWCFITQRLITRTISSRLSFSFVSSTAGSARAFCRLIKRSRCIMRHCAALPMFLIRSLRHLRDFNAGVTYFSPPNHTEAESTARSICSEFAS
jgi:hypothetical protein